MSNYIAIGKIKKPHGLSGAFHFSLQRMLKNPQKWPPHFFLEISGSFQPFFVQEWTETAPLSGFVKVEEIDSPEMARTHNNADIWVTEEHAKKFFVKSEDEYSWLIGFTAYNGDQLLGQIVSLMELPAQLLAAIDFQGKEVLAPLTDELIEKIDKRKKVVVLHLPEGLLDL